MDNTKDEGESRSTRAKAGKTGDSSSATDLTLPPHSAEERAAANESAPRSNRVGPKEPTLLQRLQNHMAAIAYAEAGEYQSARELLESVPKSKTVLLVIEGDAQDPASVSHALNLCKRTGGDLEVLQVLPLISGDSNDDPPGQEIEGTSGQLVPVVRRALSAGVTVRITMQKGEVNEKLFDYARRHKDVAMIILDSPRLRTNLPKDKVWPRLAESVAQQLSIPLITVMPKEPARALAWLPSDRPPPLESAKPSPSRGSCFSSCLKASFGMCTASRDRDVTPVRSQPMTLCAILQRDNESTTIKLATDKPGADVSWSCGFHVSVAGLRRNRIPAG